MKSNQKYSKIRVNSQKQKYGGYEDIQLQYADKEECITLLNEVGILIQGSKEDLKNRISKFRRYPKLVDKFKVRAKKKAYEFLFK